MPPDDPSAPPGGAPSRRAINATGVVLHADLGRAPLSAAARDATLAAAGYATTANEAAPARPADRTRHAAGQLARRCGTEAAAVVNNGAGAVILALAALAGDREVVASRGELLELGGTYRLTDAVAAAGARLVEVGSTNRTRLEDYRAAVGTATAVLLKVHRAGYTLEGSTEEVTPVALARLGRETGIPVVHVVGSGLLDEVEDGPLAGEPSVAASVRAGVDLVVFSGDKLLGGPQAGILVGRADLVLRLTRHPLARALALDKLRVAALEATLAAHERATPAVEVPVVVMLATEVESLQRRASWLASEIGDARAVAVTAPVGSGVRAGVEVPSWAVAVTSPDGPALVARLRAGSPPVVARLEGDEVVLDLRTVPPAQDAELVDLVLEARSGP